MSIVRSFRGVWPRLDESSWAAPNASIIGDVEVGAESSVWYGAVLRGDVMPIRIGVRTSLQDACVVHATGGVSPTIVGDECTIGHSVVLHGCTLADRVLIGMGSVVLDEAEIGSNVILGAGSLVTARTKIPSGMLAFGRPAKVVRPLREDELAHLREAAEVYVDLLGAHREADGLSRP